MFGRATLNMCKTPQLLSEAGQARRPPSLSYWKRFCIAFSCHCNTYGEGEFILVPFWLQSLRFLLLRMWAMLERKGGGGDAHLGCF